MDGTARLGVPRAAARGTHLVPIAEENSGQPQSQAISRNQSSDNGQAVREAVRELYGDEGGDKFTVAKFKAWEIGTAALHGLAENDARIFVSLTLPYSGTPEKGDLFQWAFEGLLQLIGMFLRDGPRRPYRSLVTVMDRLPADPVYESFRAGGCG